MKHLLLILSLAAATFVVPVSAQEAENGPSLMERGAQLFFEGLMREVEPALKDLEGTLRKMEPAMQDFVTRMGPALSDLLSKVDDLSRYEPPQMLPNGDIILRRKPDPIPLKPGEIEL